jgi:peptidoglycan/xylan/chitin deacetylase (PgdA/CDA1 family)
LTFDDGYDDNYLNAFPILQAWGLTGTFFIITDLVGSREYMSWEDLRVMASHGMDIEAHGRTHRDLTQLSADGVAWQARGAKTILEERLGRPVLFYAYPSGRYSTMAIRVLQDLGFRGAVATTYGATHTVSDMFSLSRVRVRRTDTLETFARKLEEAP